MKKSIDIKPKIIDDLPEELTDFAMGCLLSSAEFLDKEVEFSELKVKAKILEGIRILQIIIDAKYIIDDEERTLNGTIEKIGNDFSQYLWIIINQKELNIKNAARIVNVDYLMNIDKEKYLRNSNRRVLYNNSKIDTIIVDPIEITTDEIIEIGKAYRKENKNVL